MGDADLRDTDKHHIVHFEPVRDQTAPSAPSQISPVIETLIKKGDPQAAFSNFDLVSLNAWRTGSSYALWPYRISYVQPYGCHG